MEMAGRELKARSNWLRPPAGGFVDHAIADEVDDFHELAAVEAEAGGGGEGGEGLHEVHVGVEALAVAAGKTALLGSPVAVDVFEVAAVAGVGAVLLEQVEGAAGVVEAAGVAGGEGVLAEGVDGEAFAVDDFGRIEFGAVLLDLPEEAAVLLVPEVLEEEVDAASGHFGGAGRLGQTAFERGKPPDEAALGVDILFGAGKSVALLVEVGEEAAMFLVERAGEPEWNDSVVEVVLDGGEVAFEDAAHGVIGAVGLGKLFGLAYFHGLVPFWFDFADQAALGRWEAGMNSKEYLNRFIECRSRSLGG